MILLLASRSSVASPTDKSPSYFDQSRPSNLQLAPVTDLFQVHASADCIKLNTRTHTLASLKLYVSSAKNVAELKKYTSLPTL